MTGTRQTVLAILALLTCAVSVHAQGVGTPYRSRTPALSPWLRLYQKNTGPLDPYHMFVQPEQQLRRTFQEQQADIQRQTAGLSSLGQHVTQMEQDRNRPVQPTGVGGGFMNHNQYFGVQAGSGATARGTGGARQSWRPKAASSSSAGRAASIGR